MKNRLFHLLALLVSLSALTTVSAQSFVRGALYHLLPLNQKGNALEIDAAGKLIVAPLHEDKAGQHFNLSELSGSWRMICPFSNLAVRTSATGLEAGENNGSDEAQLWKTVEMLLFHLLLLEERKKFYMNYKEVNKTKMIILEENSMK